MGMLTAICPLSVPIAFSQAANGHERAICTTISLSDVLMVRKRLAFESQDFGFTTSRKVEWPPGRPAPNPLVRAAIETQAAAAAVRPLDMTYKSDVAALVREARSHALAHCLVHVMRRLGGGADSGACSANAVERMLSQFHGWPVEWWGALSAIGGMHVVERTVAGSGPHGSISHRPLGHALDGHELDLFHLCDFGPVDAALLATSVDPARVRDAVNAPPKLIVYEFGAAFSGQIRANNLAGRAGIRAANVIRQARVIGWAGGTAFTLGGEPFVLLSGPPAPWKRGAPSLDAVLVASVQIESRRASVSDGVSTF